MGSSREGSLTLTLKSGSLLSALKSTGSAIAQEGKRWGKALQEPTVAGLKAVRRELGNTYGDVKRTIKMAASFGGALSLGGGIKSAIDITGKFRNLAFSIQAGTGIAQDWRAMMQDVQDTAIATGQSTSELADAFKEVYEEVGDADFAKAAMKTIATQATATGDSVQSLASIAGTLNEKFGVTAKELPEALAIAKGLGEKGGIQFDEMASKLGILGASAKKAGMEGIPGFQRLIGLANSGDDALGGLRKNVSAVTSFLDKLGDTGQRKAIKQNFGVDVNDAKGKAKDATRVLGEIFAKTGGSKEKLQKVFTGEEGKLIVSLGQKYAKTFAETSGDVKTKTAAALDAYNGALDEAGRSNLNAAQVAAEAAKRAQDPAHRMQSALEHIEQAFTKPELLGALDRLSATLPGLAEKLSKLLGFVLENPGTSLAIAGGIKLGTPFIEAAMKVGAENFGKAALEALSGKGGGLGGGGGAAGTLGRVAAVAGAGFAGYEAGSAYADSVIDPDVKKQQLKTDNLQAATIAADINGDQGSVDTLRQRIAQAKKDKEFSGWDDVKTLGFRHMSTASDDDIAKSEKVLQQQEAKLKMNSKELAGAIAGETLKVQIVGGVVPGAAPTNGPPARGPIVVQPSRPGYQPR